MTAVSQILNWISDSLLLPVIVLLLAALFVSLVSLGGFCAAYFQLLRQGRRRNELLRQLRKVSGEKRAAARLRRCSGRQNGTGFRNCHCEAPKGPWQSRSTILDNKQASAKT